MISFLLPSRGRPDELLVTLKSLDLPKHNKEVLIWLDTDDPKLERYQEVLKDNPHVRVFIRERVGYINGHLMLNFLAEQARYDWYFFFNDDAYMDNPDWSDIFKDFVKQFDPAVETVVINIWGQGNKANLFPIVSRKYVDVCGHFSMGTANDDWVRIVSMRAGIDHQLYGIKPKHRKYGQDETQGDLQDGTYHDAEASRAKNGHEWNPRRGPAKHILNDDVRRVVEYNLNKKPRLSVLVPSRGRAEALKYSLSSLGLEENNLEALVWLDEDDPQLKKYQQLLADEKRVKLFIKERVGYVNFHVMLHFLATQASSDWLFMWNDDACMEDPKWFETFFEHASLVDPKEEPLVFNIWGQGDSDNKFPIISRKYFEILGYFAPTPISEAYTMRVATYSKIHRTIFGIQPKHRDLGLAFKADHFEDDTAREIIESKKRKGKNLGLLTRSMSQKRKEDTAKVNHYFNEKQKKHAGFIGLGKLGLPVALAMENRGNRIIGYDVNPKISDYLANRQVPFTEEHIDKLLPGHLLELADSIKELVQQTDLVFCAVQTPHDPRFEGHQPLPEERADFDYTYLINAVKEVAAAAAELDKKINLVVISTCLPGTYEREIKPLLTPNINYVYNPFFIAMGTVISDFYTPEFVLIGKDDGDITPLLNFYKLTIGGHNKIFTTDITTAEGIKVFYNTFITTKTVLGNMYGEFAHKLGMNVDHIHQALSLATDRLMSPKYLKSGVGDGGGCHPRDNIALSYLANEHNLSFNIFEQLTAAREKHMEWLGQLLEEEVQASGLPGVILGKSFKPETNIQTGSSAILLANILKNKGLEFEHYEFDHPNELPKAVYLIATNHQNYTDLSFPQGSTVIDPFRIIPKQRGVNVISIGQGK